MARRDMSTAAPDSDRDAQRDYRNGAVKRGFGKGEVRRANGRKSSVKDADADADGDEEDEEDEEDEDDQGEGSPRGKKRARANTTGDSVPGGSQVPQRVQVKTQPRDTDGYIPGSIVRIQLENFVTYDYVEFRPGPYLNMILGPNGTGKSSIACAICIGLNFPAKTLGRANDVHHFVKNTAEKGYVELELKGPKGRPNIIIRRNLTANSKSTTFTINDKSASGREVSEQVEKLNVQVGNKCTFLPQDKVSEFARMTSQELLKETQKAAGNENLTRWHEILISSGKDLREIQMSLDSDKATLKTAEDRNAALERDVERFRERLKLEQEQTLLEVLIPVQQYREMRVRYREIKKAQRVAVRKLQEQKEKNAPALQFKEELDMRYTKTNRLRDAAKSRMQEKMKALKNKQGANTRLEARAEDLQGELKSLKKEEKARQKKIVDTTADMEKFSAEVETLRLVELEDDDLIREELQQINNERQGVRKRVNDIQSKLIGNADRYGAQKNLIGQANMEMVKLDDVGHRRMQALQQFNVDHHDAVLWLRANKSRFKMEVFEPLFISISVKEPRKHATAMEGLISSDRLKTFVAQCQEDYDTFNRCVNDEGCLGRKANINTWFRTVNPDCMPQPPMSHDELRGLGFHGYALEFLEFPEGLRPFLTHELQLHRAAIGPSNVNVNKAMDLVTRGPGAQFVAGSTLNIVKKSAYGKRAAFNSTRDLRPAKTFVDTAVDPTLKQRWETQKRDAARQIALIEEEDAELKEQEKEVDKEDKGFRERTASCTKRRTTIQNHKAKVMRAEENLKKAERQYKTALNAPSVDEKSEGIKRELGEVVRKRKAVAYEYAHLAREILTENVEASRLALKALQIKANGIALEETIKKKQAKYNAALQEFQRINDEFDKCKTDSTEHLKLYKQVVESLVSPIKEMYEELELPRQRHDTAMDAAQKAGQPEPAPPEGMDTRSSEQMQNDVDAVVAKLELSANTNKGVLDQYNRRKEEIDNLSQTIDEKERRIARVEREIGNAKENWLPALKNLVSSIGQKFSAAFDRIGCAGEVRIGEHEDFDKWTIDILVKFRDSEKMQLLTAQRQSGGERALTTILYLLSLTEEARAPFSLVDEINQGMDARAERMVHNSMVQATCQEDSAQYFLITPKLLTDLDYHKRMKVLCVNNGEWLPDEKETGVKFGSLMGLIDGFVKARAASSQ